MRLSFSNSEYCVAVFLLISALVCMRTAAAEYSKPFWTEKSSYIEGDRLYVVGIASRAPSIEEGRKQAFANGKGEVMNFTQITDLKGLIIKTQMTYEERAGDGAYNVYRLMYVDYEDIDSLKSGQIAQTKWNYQRLQQTQEQEIAVKKTALNRLKRNKDEIALLDKEYYKIVGDVNSASDKAMRYVKVGMARNEVERLLGLPRAIYRHYDGYIYDSKYGEYWVIFDQADTVVCLSTSNTCVYENCNTDKTRCASQGIVSHFNRLPVWN